MRNWETFHPRPVRPLGVLVMAGWRLKLYSIVYGAVGESNRLDRQAYDDGLAMAVGSLPQPPVSQGRLGIGFVIMHQGRGVHYLVLNWWDNENEYFCRVFVKGFDEGETWRAASDGESSCVWDLEIIWFERNAFVEHVLSRREADVERYLGTAVAVDPAR